MGKYIVELKKNETLYKATTRESDGTAYVCSAIGTPYTAPDLEQVRKEGYKEGREAGIKDGKCEAWEAARKIIHMPEGDLLNIFTECYSAVCTALQVLLKYDASECIEKIQAYEQEEIKVGDEVELKCGVRPAIYMQGTKGSDEIYLLFNDGSCGVHSKSEIERKTGRHFHEIATVLEQMREES